MRIASIETTPMSSLIATIDLSAAAHELTGQGWNKDRVDSAIAGYRAFWTDIASGKLERPTLDVDEVWHIHKEKSRYNDESISVFGCVLEHVRDETAEPENGYALCQPVLPCLLGISIRAVH